MTKVLAVGEPVTVLPPFDDLPFLLCMQRHVRIAAVVATPVEVSYVIRLDATIPPSQQFGPIRASRLAPGWRD